MDLRLDFYISISSIGSTTFSNGDQGSANLLVFGPDYSLSYTTGLGNTTSRPRIKQTHMVQDNKFRYILVESNSSLLLDFPEKAGGTRVYGGRDPNETVPIKMDANDNSCIYHVPRFKGCVG